MMETNQTNDVSQSTDQTVAVHPPVAPVEQAPTETVLVETPLASSRTDEDGWTVQEGRKRRNSASPSKRNGKVLAGATHVEKVPSTTTPTSEQKNPAAGRQRTRPLPLTSGRSRIYLLDRVSRTLCIMVVYSVYSTVYRCNISQTP